MRAPDNFEQIGTRGFYRPIAAVASFEQALDLMTGAMEYARSIGLKDLLMNIRDLSGFTPPDTFGRYTMAVRGAAAGAGVLRVAMVAAPGIIDAEKIGVVMAQNRGLDTDVFTGEPEAIRWLDARAGLGR